ncbi:MAG: hypothetical protein HRU37_02700 [Roseibacillus sp.]|nr:hypothetical protein [Roseibacillus sp.]
MRVSFCALACLILPAGTTGAEEILLPAGGKTEWHYLDGKAAPGENWTKPGFDDSGWKKGKAPLGYGKEGLGTTIRFGDDPADKPLTAYFRKTFKVGAKEKHDFAALGLLATYDDGVAIYLNGKEVARGNLEAGKLTSRTTATQAIRESSELVTTIPAPSLKYGALNTIAVEVHQSGPTSSDLHLDLQLTGLAEGEKPTLDPYREGMRALRRGNAEEGARLLAQMAPDHPEYARTMAMLGWQVFAEGLGQPKRGLPFVKKAYEVAPTDRQVVRSYIKTHVLSGVLFDPAAIARERSKTVAAEHKFLVTKPDLGESELIARRALEEDLDYLEHVLATCFSYLELRPVDYRGALDAIRGSLAEETSLNQFRLQVAKLISLFCDGHARLSIPHSEYMPRGYAPYVAGSDQGRVYLCDGEEFLDDKHPYVKAIDGRPIAHWLEVASYVVVKESPQWRLRQSLGMLANVNYIREELGLPREEIITLELESGDRKNTRKMEVKIARRPKRETDFPDGESRRIGEVGYIRLPQMTGSVRFLAQLDRWMSRFKDTRGMIIDVRGNPGGSKDILLTLMPYFLKPGAPMRIIEFSAYRKPMELPKPMPDGFNMSAMSAQPVTSSHWKTEAQRRLIGEAIKAFKPTWPLPKGKFSDFYVLAFDSTMNPKAYYYDKPLIILQDSGSFSASDIFLGGFKGLPNTTLMGTASGGGNGWMESYTLPNTELEVVLCQTAKFRPTGEPYDGLGVPPDVVMEATPQDRLGKSDTVLDAAVKRLSR